MNASELIRKKRDGAPLSRKELEAFISAYVRGEVPDYQMSALLMAVYFRGMTDEETAAFTSVMLHSGRVVDLSMIPGLKVDKHSTGGVGDKVSLILAPLVASCGVPVPMISGRGLGHTGGTLDKLESIPGFRTGLTIEEYQEIISRTGLVMIGQTAEIAPADKRMYALRDVTATVESIPLIAGSIMSKKLAEGIDCLVLDIKTGAGAFMPRYEDSLALARALVGIGTQFGKKTVGLITEMDQPLGCTVGNWCEVVESVECLKGKKVPDLMEVTYALGALMLVVGEKASSVAEGLRRCEEAVWSGRAYEKFLELVRAQGGDTSWIESPAQAPPPRFSREVKAAGAGYVASFATREVGVLAAELGAGRKKVDDQLDIRAGITFRKKLGDPVGASEPLATLYADDQAKLDRAAAVLPSLMALGPEPVPLPPRCRTVVYAGGEEPWEEFKSRSRFPF
ncbi:MAG TPA: thymidine phosphorylase [Bacteroidota bacterium]